MANLQWKRTRAVSMSKECSLCSDRKGENRSDGLHGAVEVQDAKRGDTAGDTCLVDSPEGDTCCYCCNCAMFGSRLDCLFCTKRQTGCTIEAFVKKWGGVAHKRQHGKLMKHKHDSRWRRRRTARWHGAQAKKKSLVHSHCCREKLNSHSPVAKVAAEIKAGRLSSYASVTHTYACTRQL